VVNSKAAESLGDIGDPRAIDPLVEALDDEDWDVRSKAAEALEKLGWQG
jgi:HEAT repeat protein